jgi:hypothetical protein
VAEIQPLLEAVNFMHPPLLDLPEFFENCQLSSSKKRILSSFSPPPALDNITTDTLYWNVYSCYQSAQKHLIVLEFAVR